MDISERFCAFYNDSGIKRYTELIRRNSKGKIWIIGGFVYRNLVSLLQNRYQIVHDIDFLAETPQDTPISLPRGWKMRITNYGNPSFMGPNMGEKQILLDLNYLNSFHSVIARNLPPVIESFLSGTPLTIQSIAFDIESGKVVGDIGINSIEKKIIAINNLAEAKYEAERRKVSLERYVRKKARELGFSFNLERANKGLDSLVVWPMKVK